MNRFRYLLIFFYVITISVLFITPGRHIALSNIKCVFQNLCDLHLKNAENLPPSYQKDYRIQMAVPIMQTDKSRLQVERLHTLTTRYPANPSIYANMMRLECLDLHSIKRPESALLTFNTIPNDRDKVTESDEDWAQFEHNCRSGEAVDQDNAFFPFMLAAALYKQHRDDEAAVAIHRAASKSEWKEYCDDIIVGQWKICDYKSGIPNSITHAVVASSMLYPHYAMLRNLSRMAAYQAMEKECSGNAKDGIQIRMDLLKLSGLMRTQSKTLIGNLIGIAIGQTAILRPAGSPILEKDKSVSRSDQEVKLTRDRIEAFTSYVSQAGYPQYAMYASKEANNGLKTLNIINSSNEKDNITVKLTREMVTWQLSFFFFFFFIECLACYWAITWIMLKWKNNDPKRAMPVAFILICILIMMAGRVIHTENLRQYISLISTDLINTKNGMDYNLIKLLFIHFGIYNLIIAVSSAIKHIPFSTGFTKGVVSVMPVLMCLLLILYTGSAVFIGMNDRFYLQQLDQLPKGELKSMPSLYALAVPPADNLPN